jgi:hypothetical protein
MQSPVDPRLITPCVTSEVVAILKDKNPRIALNDAPIVVGRGQPADASANDDEVIMFA